MATSKAPLTRLAKFLSSPVLLCALAMAAAMALAIPQAHAANIIGFANNATACGGSMLWRFSPQNLDPLGVSAAQACAAASVPVPRAL